MDSISTSIQFILYYMYIAHSHCESPTWSSRLDAFGKSGEMNLATLCSVRTQDSDVITYSLTSLIILLFAV